MIGAVAAKARLGSRAGAPQNRPAALAKAQAANDAEPTATGTIPPTAAIG